jgi:hypothetical protein
MAWQPLVDIESSEGARLIHDVDDRYSKAVLKLASKYKRGFKDAGELAALSRVVALELVHPDAASVWEPFVGCPRDATVETIARNWKLTVAQATCLRVALSVPYLHSIVSLYKVEQLCKTFGPFPGCVERLSYLMEEQSFDPNSTKLRALDILKTRLQERARLGFKLDPCVISRMSATRPGVVVLTVMEPDRSYHEHALRTTHAGALVGHVHRSLTEIIDSLFSLDGLPLSRHPRPPDVFEEETSDSF